MTVRAYIASGRKRIGLSRSAYFLCPARYIVIHSLLVIIDRPLSSLLNARRNSLEQIPPFSRFPSRGRDKSRLPARVPSYARTHYPTCANAETPLRNNYATRLNADVRTTAGGCRPPAVMNMCTAASRTVEHCVLELGRILKRKARDSRYG